MRESDWYKLSVCSKCEHTLSDRAEYYGNGICPHCGHDSDSTICDTKYVILKETKHYNWWDILSRERTYRGKNEFSKSWLLNN